MTAGDCLRHEADAVRVKDTCRTPCSVPLVILLWYRYHSVLATRTLNLTFVPGSLGSSVWLCTRVVSVTLDDSHFPLTFSSE